MGGAALGPDIGLPVGRICIMSDEPGLLAEADKHVKAAHQVISPATVCIYRRLEDGIEAIASGILVNTPSEVVMLTAAHVTDYYKQEHPLCTVRRKQLGDRKGIPLGPPLWKASRIREYSDRTDDPFDLAVVRFPAYVRNLLLEHYSPIELDSVDPDDHGVSEHVYLAYGYPIETNEPSIMMGTITQRPLSVITKTRVARHPIAPAYDQKIDILVSYEAASDSTGAAIVPPNPKGMSGCGLWRVGRDPFPGMGRSPEKVVLVGLVHTHFKQEKLIRSTQIQHLMAAARATFLQTPNYNPDFDYRQ